MYYTTIKVTNNRKKFKKNDIEKIYALSEQLTQLSYSLENVYSIMKEIITGLTDAIKQIDSMEKDTELDRYMIKEMKLIDLIEKSGSCACMTAQILEMEKNLMLEIQILGRS